MPYSSPQAGTIARLILEEGDARANALRGSADAWAGGVSSLGKQAGGTLRDLATYQETAPQRALAQAQAKHTLTDLKVDDQVRDIARTAPPDPKTGGLDYAGIAKSVQQLDPQKALAWWQKASDEQKLQLSREKERATDVSQTAGSILSADPARRPVLYAQARAAMISKGYATEDQIPTGYDENWLQQKFMESATISQQIDHAEKLVDQEIARTRANQPKDQNWSSVTLLGPDKKPVDALFENNSGTYYTTDKKPITGPVTLYDKPEKVGTREVRINNPDGSETIQLVPDRPGATYTSAPKKAGDDPELPQGVVDYIGAMRQKKNAAGQPYSYEDAQADLAGTWNGLRKDHPRLSVTKADDALRSLFRPAPGAGAQSFADAVGAAMRGETPGAPATRPPTPAPASTPTPAPSSKSAAPAAKTAAPTMTPGQRVKAKDGKWYVVGKVYPDGSWDPR